MRAPRSTRWLAALGSALATSWLSCAGPIVEGHVHEVAPRALRLVAVAPFLPDPDFRGSLGPRPAPRLPNEPVPPTGADAAEAAALVTRFVTEAFAERGFEVIPASDLVGAFQTRAPVVPHGDVKAAAELAAQEFGATSLLTGSVYRYRERVGGELGATGPASVGYLLSLHAAPSGRVLWTARFDHTQRAVSEDLFRARTYPGAGSRWLTAAQLARWGARSAADVAIELRWVP